MSNSITKPKIYKHTTLLDEEERFNLEKIASIKNLNMSDIVRGWIKKEIKKLTKELQMNSIILIGSIGKDLLSISEKTSVFSICVNEQKKNESGGYETISTTWFNCNLSGKSLNEYKHLVKKGAILGVIGKNIYNEVNEKTYHNVLVYKILDVATANQFRKDFNNLTKELQNETQTNNNVTGYEEPPISQRDLDDEVPFLNKIGYWVYIFLIMYGCFNIGKLYQKDKTETLINELENNKKEYCEVIAKLEWYAPDSVKYPYKHIIEFAKLQEFQK